MSESVPNATSTFSYQRTRRDSTASFQFYDDEDQQLDEEEWPEWQEEEAVLDEQDRLERQSIDDANGFLETAEDLESLTSAQQRRSSSRRRKSSELSKASRNSAEAPLLQRHTSGQSRRSEDSAYSGFRVGGRVSQKIYILTEDMTIVVAGFRTSLFGFALYICICALTLGVGYLILRWLPKWYVKLVGRSAPLAKCDWVIIENQWGELAVQKLNTRPFGQSLSSVFGSSEKGKLSDFDEYDDPIMEELRILDYRYIRFCYHPLRDKFVLGNVWKDPNWTDVTSVRAGIDSDEQELRERIFGGNTIDIEQKSTVQLLLDEVLHPFYVFQVASIILWSMDQYYYYAGCIFVISVVSVVTTLFEMKATMKRLREISLFECDVRVLRSGFWRYVESKELVPGGTFPKGARDSFHPAN